MVGLQAQVPRTFNKKGVTEGTTLVWCNNGPVPASTVWLTHDWKQVQYSLVQPGDVARQSTYNTHTWQVICDGKPIFHYQGPSAVVTINPDLTVSTERVETYASTPHPTWGRYRVRGSACGIPVKAFDCVDESAVRHTEHLLTSMLQGTPQHIRERLVRNKCAVAIIALCQATTNIPEHWDSRFNSRGARDLNATTRGLGSSLSNPVSSCGEENILMLPGCRYKNESLLVHEFAHSVMNLGFDGAMLKRVAELYTRAKAKGLYKPDRYIMENEKEYFAEASQAWFHATIRTDVTDGVNTRQGLRNRDPELAAFMGEVYGNNSWVYPHSAKRPFGYGNVRAGGHDVPPRAHVHVPAAGATAPALTSGVKWNAQLGGPGPTPQGGGARQRITGVLSKAVKALKSL